MNPGTLVLHLYPRWWRERYDEEVAHVLDSAPRNRDVPDLLRGAMDAWLHPPTPSRVPAIAALSGGALWTATSVALASDPLPDWPGYTMTVLPLAIAATFGVLVAITGVWIRLGDRTARLERAVGVAAVAAHAAWLVGLAAMFAGLDAALSVAVASAAGAILTAVVAMLLLRRGDVAVAVALAAAPLALSVSAAQGWLPYGLAWSVAGLVMWATTPANHRLLRVSH